MSPTASTPPNDEMTPLLAASDLLYANIEGVLSEWDWPGLDERGIATLMLSQLGFEHGVAMRTLIEVGLLTSAVALLRVQFEAVVRGAWLLHAATDEQAQRLSAPLTLEGEQGAKNLPSLDQMIARLEKDGPRGAGALLRRFHSNLGRGLNSFVHAGIHPIHRSAAGFPVPLVRDLVKCSNGVAMLATVVLSELCAPVPKFNERYKGLYERHHEVLPGIEPL